MLDACETKHDEYLRFQAEMRLKCVLTRDELFGSMLAFERINGRTAKSVIVNATGMRDLEKWNESPCTSACGLPVTLDADMVEIGKLD